MDFTRVFRLTFLISLGDWGMCGRKDISTLQVAPRSASLLEEINRDRIAKRLDKRVANLRISCYSRA